ncbi:predicted protein [Thalassiosira pseudonana CCMP1335]|uniref:VWFA domain-containing protein n=1 Tax=Thalassiosira pseudonana TaxID=35128 RepID=B8C4H1_THAPS|nr:predicted protein [Thalassiosira pseudonana CCMP1335]EED91722.1 predicted protein [Thalassiosira pseudonana CCMP1335]
MGRLFTLFALLLSACSCRAFSHPSSNPSPTRYNPSSLSHHLSHVSFPGKRQWMPSTLIRSVAETLSDAGSYEIPTRISDASERLDPLLTSFLLRSVRIATSDDADDDDDMNSRSSPLFTISDASKAMQGNLVLVGGEGNEEDDEDDMWEEGIEDELLSSDQFEYEPLSADELEQLAESLTGTLSEEWGGVVQGVSLLDKVFGYDHNLLDLKGDDGFGLQDGIWQHNGWQPIPDLQRRLSMMPKLKDLLARLGQRPSAKGKDVRKFRPRKRSNSRDDMMGVEIDPLDPTSVSGLTRSGSLTTMLPSEAVLLRSSMKSLRWLFLAKKAESKLLVSLPSASGGPLIICLDTSWSMSGARESLAKAVVLASVSAANSQGRECRVVSFSSANNAVESGSIKCDSDGVRKLLDFLSYSFGGGTDVTGALKYALILAAHLLIAFHIYLPKMETLETDLASSDLLLVSDGEIPNPPVSNVVFAKLEALRLQTGMEIHGLLVGKRESPALSSLCTEVHDFLVDYEYYVMHRSGLGLKSSTALSLRHIGDRRGWASKTHQKPMRMLLSSRRYDSSLRATLNDYDYDERGIPRQRKRDGRSGSIRRRFDNDDDNDDDWELDEDSYTTSGRSPSTKQPTINAEASEYVQRVEATFDSLQNAATTIIEDSKWTDKDMDTEIEHSSTWKKSKALFDCITFVQSGLIERDVEARLVVLGMVSEEHVLFIGPPGTSKSELGRRLSMLCGGPFFQRLFTRFTTPEEIFGPLSLRALENDEYTRCIDGFLPTATVAFLDEIFKANSAILNTLLTILNERQFDNGAGKRVQCPLKCVIGASNELPESDDLDALLDRFLIRAEVFPVSDDGLLEILSLPITSQHPADINVADDLKQLVTDVSGSLDNISMQQNISILIRDLRSFVRDDLGVYVSDRRLVKAARLLRVCASTHGRSRVDLVDCLLLQHILWQIPEQRESVREWLWDNLTPGESDQVVQQSRFLLGGLASESLALVKKTMGDISGEFGAREADLKTIKTIEAEVQKIQAMLCQHCNELQRHIVLVDRLTDHLWIGHDEAIAAKQHLLPLAKAASLDAEHLLKETIALKLALSNDIVDNELRSSVIQLMASNGIDDNTMFSEEELQLSLKEAKRSGRMPEDNKW